ETQRRQQHAEERGANQGSASDGITGRTELSASFPTSPRTCTGRSEVTARKLPEGAEMPAKSSESSREIFDREGRDSVADAIAPSIERRSTVMAADPVSGFCTASPKNSPAPAMTGTNAVEDTLLGKIGIVLARRGRALSATRVARMYE